MLSAELPICVACGAQYESRDGIAPDRCKICDDPRQYVPPAGQQWTTLVEMRKRYKNKIVKDPENDCITSIFIEPKINIGERAVLIETPNGNVLWDLIALLDDETTEFIKSKGGLKAIVISHPHFYTTYVEWAQTFDCPVFISKEDEMWLCRRVDECIKFISGPVGTTKSILPGITAIKTGGHFDGSLVLHWQKTMFIADAFLTVPSAYSPHPRPKGHITYSFMWSIPNAIPLPPAKIVGILSAVAPFEFETTQGLMFGMTVKDTNLKQRLLESACFQVSSQGFRAWIEDGSLEYRSIESDSR